MTYEPSTFDSSITSESDLYISSVKDSEGFVVSDYESELYGGEREIWERKLKTVSIYIYIYIRQGLLDGCVDRGQ